MVYFLRLPSLCALRCSTGYCTDPDEGGDEARSRSVAEKYRELKGFVPRDSEATRFNSEVYTKEIAHIQRQEALENQGRTPKGGLAACAASRAARSKRDGKGRPNSSHCVTCCLQYEG